MTETSLIHARINGHLNVQAMAVLDALGLAALDAVRLLSTVSLPIRLS
jgi:antitoxin component of RelBE/YafQ-DinJ toxin-antitoxin module